MVDCIYQASLALPSFSCRQDDNWDTLNNYTGSFVDTFSDDALIGGFSEWGAQLRIGRSRSFVLRLDEVLLAHVMGLEIVELK